MATIYEQTGRTRDEIIKAFVDSLGKSSFVWLMVRLYGRKALKRVWLDFTEVSKKDSIKALAEFALRNADILFYLAGHGTKLLEAFKEPATYLFANVPIDSIPNLNYASIIPATDEELERVFDDIVSQVPIIQIS